MTMVSVDPQPTHKKGEVKKISVCGKGGSGKSTIVALLAMEMRRKGYRVLVVDSDESNTGLYRMLGFEARPQPLLELVGGKKKVFDAFSEDADFPESVLTRSEIRTEDLPEQHIIGKDGIQLVCTGKILQSLEGCACPMGALTREFLGRLRLGEEEVAIVDMEAGIEHFGRGVETNIDSVIVVVEPSYDSLELADKINQLTTEVGVRNTWNVLNKASSEEIVLRMGEALKEKGISLVGVVADDPEIFHSNLNGEPIRAGEAERNIKEILDRIL
jgi:CO dehydrogenase maturation factor